MDVKLLGVFNSILVLLGGMTPDVGSIFQDRNNIHLIQLDENLGIAAHMYIVLPHGL